MADPQDDKERKVRERAHAIWESEGRPHGRDREHWERACREVDDESGSGERRRDGGLSNQEEVPTASVGVATGLHPSGTAPDGGPGAGIGSIGTGGGSTGGAATGSVAERRRR